MFKVFIFIAASLFALEVSACDFKTEIKKVEGGYLYSKKCHIKVGKIKKENELRKIQVSELTEALKLKNLALEKSEERTLIWKETAFKLEDRILKIERYDKWSGWVKFGLGVVTTGVAAYTANKVMGQ